MHARDNNGKEVDGKEGPGGNPARALLELWREGGESVRAMCSIPGTLDHHPQSPKDPMRLYSAMMMTFPSPKGVVPTRRFVRTQSSETAVPEQEETSQRHRGLPARLWLGNGDSDERKIRTKPPSHMQWCFVIGETQALWEGNEPVIQIFRSKDMHQEISRELPEEDEPPKLL